MHSNILYILYFINCVNVMYATRLPMEIIEVNTSHVLNDEKKLIVVKHKLLDSHTTMPPTTTTTTTTQTITNQRKARQMEEIQIPRILYQVGNSENDLPICAINAVCSKIDLYETPWIERQCRCPKTTVKHSHTINHPKDTKFKLKNNYNSQQYLENTDHDYDNDNNQHLKALFRKLGVFYDQDDIILNENDYIDSYAAATAAGSSSTINNKNPLTFRNKFNEYHDLRKLRHSAHRTDIQRIGGCPSAVGVEDGHTIADKTRHYKLCEPIHKLPQCRYFRDYTWTLKSSPDMNVTEQIVHCRCPRNSVTYLIKREPLQASCLGFTYLFACSPQSRLRCQRKEPCKLFTVRKRQEFLDEVNTNPLCQCPKSHRCPKRHTDSGVLIGKSYIEDNIRTYSGYCMPTEN